jgi:hypothetical protein
MKTYLVELRYIPSTALGCSAPRGEAAADPKRPTTLRVRKRVSFI